MVLMPVRTMDGASRPQNEVEVKEGRAQTLRCLP